MFPNAAVPNTALGLLNWGEFNTLVDQCMSNYDVPDKAKKVAAE